jgi:hypothetical protein
VSAVIFGEEYKLRSSRHWYFIHPPVTPCLLGPNVFLGTLCEHLQSTTFPQGERPNAFFKTAIEKHEQ